MNPKKQILISHPTGNTFVRSLLDECKKQDRLAKFFTTLGKGETPNILLNKILHRRTYSVPDEKICCQWFPEIRRLLFGKYVSQNKRRTWSDRSYDQLDRTVSNKLQIFKPTTIHAYEDGAVSPHSFRRAKELGIHCSYELPIAHWATTRRLLNEEAERHPEWIPTLDSIHENENKLCKKKRNLNLLIPYHVLVNLYFKQYPKILGIQSHAKWHILVALSQKEPSPKISKGEMIKS